ncbi:MAG: aspartate--tRNA ligase [Cyclonatronaceae bacterium]
MLLKRTHTCGALNLEHCGQEVTLNGWVNTRRDLGGVIFIDLRDRYGLTQVVFSPQDQAEAHRLADELRSEYVIGIKGIVRERDTENINPNLATGQIEVRVQQLHIYSRANTPPFEIKDDLTTNEEVRLKHRYLDLRRRPLQNNLMLRSKVYQAARNYFYEQEFAEIETPFLMRSTPEGARDYLVPSRVNPGKFYALPQSPQIYKQTLMISGMDRYFQIVKCFRDEDLRADRQPEFTQIDAEMSFVDEESIYAMAEGMMKRILVETQGVEIQTPFPRMSYKDAIETYGSDKPDTRFDLRFKDLSPIVADSGFRVFSKTVADGGKVVGFVAPGFASLGRGIMDRLTKRVQKEIGAGGLIYIKHNGDELYSSVSKFVSEQTTRRMAETAGAKEGDLVLILVGAAPLVYEQLGDLRLMFAKEYELIDTSRTDFLWVTDFPLLEYSAEEGRYYAMHHPFTAPHPEDLELLDSNPGKARARGYDMVMNGSEIGGGSIRIHEFEMQKKMFSLLGIDEAEAREKFGFLLDAFEYGAPPHGGIAFGLDRIVMLLAGAQSLREVIAFPKNQRAQSTMDSCPDEVDSRQLDELYIQLKPILKS